jgi:hypothetical protein
VDRASFPTAGQVYRDQLRLDVPAAAIDHSLDEDARENHECRFVARYAQWSFESSKQRFPL